MEREKEVLALAMLCNPYKMVLPKATSQKETEYTIYNDGFLAGYSHCVEDQQKIDIAKGCRILEDILYSCLIPGVMETEDFVEFFKKRMYDGELG